MYDLKFSTPEAEGISSRHIIRLIKKLNDHQIPMHSLLIARHGKVIYEGYYAPYDEKTPHRMYSETKSYVSLAIGLLVSDGKISLDDKICDYFKDYLPGVVHPWLQEMTIRHMLTMRTCHDKTTYIKDSTTQNWGRSFFQKIPTHRPGTVFQYDTSGTFVLGELVERVTGKNVDDYLKENFLGQLGIGDDFYIMRDSFGTCRGGCGLMTTPRNMMKVGLMLMNDGKHPEHYRDGEGEQIYPYDYLKQATSFQTSTVLNRYERNGYGFKFWMLQDGGYAMFGMGSQHVMCFPKQDLVIVNTADTQGIPNGSDMLCHDIEGELLEKLEEQALPEDAEAAAELAKLTETLHIPYAGESVTPNWQAQVDGVDYFLESNPTGFHRFRLVFEEEDQGYLEWQKEKGTYKLPFALNGLKEGVFPEFNQPCYTSAVWCEENGFYILAWLTGEEISSVHFKLIFLPDGGITVLMKKTEDVYLNEYQGLLNGHK